MTEYKLILADSVLQMETELNLMAVEGWLLHSLAPRHWVYDNYERDTGEKGITTGVNYLATLMRIKHNES